MSGLASYEQIASRRCELCDGRVDGAAPIVGLCAGCSGTVQRDARHLQVDLAAERVNVGGVHLWRWRDMLRVDWVEEQRRELDRYGKELADAIGAES